MPATVAAIFAAVFLVAAIVGATPSSASDRFTCSTCPEFWFLLENNSDHEFGELYVQFDGFVWKEDSFRPGSCCITGPIPVALPEFLEIRWEENGVAQHGCVPILRPIRAGWRGEHREVTLRILDGGKAQLSWVTIDSNGEPTDLGIDPIVSYLDAA